MGGTEGASRDERSKAPATARGAKASPGTPLPAGGIGTRLKGAAAGLDTVCLHPSLCLGTGDTPVSVAFPAGVFVDPNEDLNPETSVAVRPSL